MVNSPILAIPTDFVPSTVIIPLLKPLELTSTAIPCDSSEFTIISPAVLFVASPPFAERSPVVLYSPAPIFISALFSAFAVYKGSKAFAVAELLASITILSDFPAESVEVRIRSFSSISFDLSLLISTDFSASVPKLRLSTFIFFNTISPNGRPVESSFST